MNKILQTIIKEIFLYWFVASIILLCCSFVYNLNLTFKIMSILSTIISKLIFEDYISKYYLNYNKPKNDFNVELERIK